MAPNIAKIPPTSNAAATPYPAASRAAHPRKSRPYDRHSPETPRGSPLRSLSVAGTFMVASDLALQQAGRLFIVPKPQLKG
jgi:hypothetical protein